MTREERMRKVAKEFGYGDEVVEIIKDNSGNVPDGENRIKVLNVAMFEILSSMEELDLMIMATLFQMTTGLDFNKKTDFVEYISKTLSEEDYMLFVASTVAKMSEGKEE